MSVVNLVGKRIIERRNCDFVIFGNRPHTASADEYS